MSDQTTDSTVVYTIRTLSRGSHMIQSSINKTEDEAKELFMERFGYDAITFNTVYISDTFNPKDIQSSNAICDNCEWR